MLYKGHRIVQNHKTTWHKDRLSGHEWSELTLLSTYSIHGPFTLQAIDGNYRSIKKAKEAIDFRIKFGLHLPENNGCNYDSRVVKKYLHR